MGVVSVLTRSFTVTPSLSCDSLPAFSNLFERHFADYDPDEENSRPVLIDAWRKGTIPNNWIRADFTEQESGLNVPCFRSNAREPWLELRFVLGFKAVPMAYFRQIKLLNNLGVSVTTMVLPDTGRKPGFMPPCMRATHRFLTDDTLTIHQTSNPDIPRAAMDHSTGGLCYALNEMNPDKRKQYNQTFIRAIHMASFFGIAGANEKFTPFKKRMLEWLKPKDRSRLTSETRQGRIYAAFMALWQGDPGIYSSVADPSFEAMEELESYGLKYLSQLESKPVKSDVTQVFVVPKKDNVACPLSLRFVAKLLGGETFQMKNFHNPWIESPRRYTRKLVETLLEGVEELGPEQNNLPTGLAKNYIAEESLRRAWKVIDNPLKFTKRFTKAMQAYSGIQSLHEHPAPNEISTKTAPVHAPAAYAAATAASPSRALQAS